jgi:phage shock protein A
MLEEIAELKLVLASKNEAVTSQRATNENLKKENQHLTEKILMVRKSMTEAKNQESQPMTGEQLDPETECIR